MRRLIIVVIVTLVLISASLFLFDLPDRSSKISWQLNDGLTRTIVWDIAISEHEIYAGTDNGLYQSEDGGITWIFNDLVDAKTRGSSESFEFDKIRDIYVKPSGEIFVATWGGSVYWRSADNRNAWELFFPPEDVFDKPDYYNSFLHARTLIAAGVNDETIYVGTQGGVLTPGEGNFLQPTGLALGSLDACATQAQTYTLVSGINSVAIPVHDLAIDPRDSNHIYTAIWNFGVCHSTDAGDTWAKLGDGPADQILNANVLVISPQNPDTIYLGTFGQGIYRSENGGQSWEALNNGDLPENADIWSMQFAPDGKLYAGTRYDGTFVLAPGSEWTKIEEFPFGALSLALEPGTNSILAGTWGGGIFRQNSEGSEWSSLNMPLLPLPINALVQNNEGLFVGTDNDGVWRSLDQGQNWTRAVGKRPGKDEDEKSQGDYLDSEALVVETLLVGADNHTLYAGTGKGLYKSDNNGDTWRHFPESPGDVVSLLEVKQSNRDVILAGTRSHGLYLFSSEDESWQDRQGLQGHVNALAHFQDRIYASSVGFGLFETSAAIPTGGLNDSSWKPVDLPARYVQKLTVVADNTWWQRLFHGSSDQLLAITERGLYRTQDGSSWPQVNPGSFSSLALDAQHPQVVYLSVLTTTYAVSVVTNTTTSTPTEATPETFDPRAEGFTLLLSPDNGKSWTPTVAQTQVLTTPSVAMIADANQSGHLFAATQNGLYVGQIVLPPLWQEIFFYLGFWLIGLFILLFIGVTYRLVAQPYQITLPRSAYLLSFKFPQLNLVWERGGLTRLSDVEQLVLLTAPLQAFYFSDIWKNMERMGAVPAAAALHEALSSLVYVHKLLGRDDKSYKLELADLQKIAAKTFGRRIEEIKRRIRRERSIYRDVEQFFDQAGFEVRDLDQEYRLQPRTPDHSWTETWVWLRLSEPLTSPDVAELSDQMTQLELAGPAFVIIASRPTLEGYQALARRNALDQPNLVLLDAQTIRRALEERRALATLDVAIRQARPGYDHFALYAPVGDPVNFFGREILLDNLYESLTQNSIPITIVSGLPKIGLTSLLQQLRSRLETLACALIDVQSEYSLATLHHTIINNLLDDVQRKYQNPRLNRRINELKSARPDDEVIGQLFQSLEMTVNGSNSNQKFAVLVDASGSVPGEAESLVQAIRKLTETYSQLLFVIAHNDFVRSDETLPAPDFALGPLSKAETDQMFLSLLAAMGREAWPVEILDLLYHESGGHPWLIRQLGSALSQYDHSINPGDIEKVAFELVQMRSTFFESLWESLPSDIQANLLSVSEPRPAWLQEVGLFQGDDIQIGLWQRWLALELGLANEHGEHP